MRYTVSKLAKLSGVSVRTLHFYDEIGLLKPSFYGENHYRYYEEKQLLMLQQILFFRELGFSLEEIQRIINSNEFNQIDALNSHRKILENRLEQTENLIKTIDKTLLHLKGKLAMRNEELFVGFDPKKQQEYEKYLVNSGKVTQEQIKQSWENVKHWKKADFTKHKEGCDAIIRQFAELVEQQSDPASVQVQACVRKLYDWIKVFWTPDKRAFIGLSQLYNEHPDFRQFYEGYHPDLLSLLTQAMKIFAERELT